MGVLIAARRLRMGTGNHTLPSKWEFYLPREILIAARRLRMGVCNHALLSKWKFYLPPEILIAVRRLRMGVCNHALLSKWKFYLLPDAYGWAYVTMHSYLNGNFDCRQTLKLDHVSPTTPLPGTNLSSIVATVLA